MGAEFVQLSLTPMLTGMLAAIACALPGNFLLLRRQALVGDAISHVVLPGIVVAFLLTGTAVTSAMLAGAGAAALVAVTLMEIIRRYGRVEAGAAMGIVFTAMFASGVVLLEQSDASRVHLDVEHTLYGNLESLVWLSAEGWHSLLDLAALAALPPQLPRLIVVAVVLFVLIRLFWRPITIATFDETYARSIGLPTRLIGIGIIAAAAVAAVSAFEAVGSIIVIAMFVCPPAAARLMTNNLVRQVGLSVSIAAISAITGYVLAGHAPGWFRYDVSVSAAGMIALVSGAILALACLWGPCRARVAGAG